MKNFIQLTKVSIRDNNEVTSTVSIKPADILVIEDVVSERHPKIKASVTIAHYVDPCPGFNFNGPILVKETPEEIDKICEDFYDAKRKK